MNEIKVLLVEDDSDIVENLTEFLRTEGYLAQDMHAFNYKESHDCPDDAVRLERCIIDLPHFLEQQGSCFRARFYKADIRFDV